MRHIRSVAMLSAAMACASIGCAGPSSELDIAPSDVLGGSPDARPTAIDSPFGGTVTAMATAAPPRAPTPRDAGLHAQASTAVAGLMLNLWSTDRLGSDLAYVMDVQLMA